MFDFDDALENYVIRAKNSIRRSFFDHVVITAIAAVATLMAFSQIFILAETFEILPFRNCALHRLKAHKETN